MPLFDAVWDSFFEGPSETVEEPASERGHYLDERKPAYGDWVCEQTQVLTLQLLERLLQKSFEHQLFQAQI